MADRVLFGLVTPERLRPSPQGAKGVRRRTPGKFGGWPGRTPPISTIRPGMIEDYETRPTVSERIFVVSGIAEVTPERCTVLAEEAMAPTSLDRAAIEAELQVVEGNLPSLREQVGRATGTDRDRLAAELRSLEHQEAVPRAKLQALVTTAH